MKKFFEKLTKKCVKGASDIVAVLILIAVAVAVGVALAPELTDTVLDFNGSVNTELNSFF